MIKVRGPAGIIQQNIWLTHWVRSTFLSVVKLCLWKGVTLQDYAREMAPVQLFKGVSLLDLFPLVWLPFDKQNVFFHYCGLMTGKWSKCVSLGPSTFLLLGTSQEECAWTFLLEPFVFPLFVIPESSTKFHVFITSVTFSFSRQLSFLYCYNVSIEVPVCQPLTLLVLKFVPNKIPDDQTFVWCRILIALRESWFKGLELVRELPAVVTNCYHNL